MGEAVKRIKKSQASLIGGFIVGTAGTALAVLVMTELNVPDPARWIVGAAIGIAAGVWIRVADL